MLTVAIHQPQYLPWIPFFGKAAACDLFIYLDNVQYQKNGVQNRNQINTTTGPIWLTVPVRANSDALINQVTMADQKWRRKHVAAVEQIYAKAPYIPLFKEGLKSIIDQEWPNLAELNIAVSEWMFQHLSINCRRVRASELNATGSKSDLVISLCKSVGATEYLSGHGAKAYQEESQFTNEGLRLRYHDFHHPIIYPQCHPNSGFQPNLSALDLILNVGPAAGKLVSDGNKPNEQRPSNGA